MYTKKTVKEVIEYCLENHKYMWAATIISMLLGCEFRDCKEEAEKYLREHNV